MDVTPIPARARPALWPFPLVLLVAALLEGLDLDRGIAHALFYRADQLWLGAGSGAWWATGLIHGGGRTLVRGVAAAALAWWLLSFRIRALASWRREALFVFAGLVLVTATVGLLKVLTNVDCPWDLAGFGGNQPYIPLLGDRPDYLPAARCFPGAHSSSGFALMGLWFALRERRPRAARFALWFAISVGALFSFGQQARGAHFLSHDLASAALAWAILRALHARVFAPTGIPAPASTQSFPTPGIPGCFATSTATAKPPARR
jgi:membrane-associated PAP2 superfamily phosphatase